MIRARALLAPALIHAISVPKYQTTYKTIILFNKHLRISKKSSTFAAKIEDFPR